MQRQIEMIGAAWGLGGADPGCAEAPAVLVPLLAQRLAACGLPAIATDWGGHTAFLDPSDTYPLRVRALIPAASPCAYYEGFRWADPDAEHLAFLLRHVYDNRDDARRIGAEAAREMAEKWTWHRSASRIAERLEALA